MPGMRYQPQGRIQIDYGSPLARGIVGAFIASNPDADVLGAAVKLAGGISAVTTPVGMLLGGFAANAGSYAEIAHPAVSGAFSVAFAVLFQRRGGTQSFVAQGGSGSGNGWSIATPANNNSLQLTLGGVASFTIASNALVAEQINRVVVRVSGNGGSASAWVNGSLVGTVSIGTMRTPASSGTLIGVAKQATAYVDPVAFRSAIGDVLLYDRAVSDDEGAALSSNPYQVFVDEENDEVAAPKSHALRIDCAPLVIGGGLVRMAASRRMLVAAVGLSIAPGSVSMHAARRLAVDPVMIAVSAGRVETLYSPKPIPSSYTLPVATASIRMAGGEVGMRLARRLVVTPGRPDLRAGQVRLLVRRRLQVSSARLDLSGGSVTLRFAAQSAPIDISKIHPSRIVIFEGSGSRMVVFEGSGSRVVVFEGSGKRLRINKMDVKVPIKIGERWTTDRDRDEISWHGADVTNELAHRNTTALPDKVIALLYGVELLEGPLIEVATIDGVERTFVVVKLGGVDGDLPKDWRWVARVPCANGERFDKTTWFNEVDP